MKIKKEKIYLLFFLFILILGVSLRWYELERIAGTPLEPDTQGYYNYAQQMDLFSKRGFYSATFGMREPFYIFIVKIFFLFLGAEENSIRVVSFVFSILMIYLIYLIGKRWFNKKIGLLASFFIATNPYLISLSVSGYREELFICLFLFFFYLTYLEDRITLALRSLLAGLVGGIIVLTRSEGFIMITLCLLSYLYFAKPRWKIKHLLITLFIVIILIFPHFYSMAKVHGDPFYTHNMNARFFANLEFGGKEGFPSLEEIKEKGMYTGPKITPFEYFFKLHTPWEVLFFTCAGYILIYIRAIYYAILPTTGLNIRKALSDLIKNFSLERVIKFAFFLLRSQTYSFIFSIIGLIFTFGFFIGLIFIIKTPFKYLLLLMVITCLQVAFLAWVGCSPRLYAHSLLFSALLSAFGINRFFQKIIS